jgi:hypothetical protein
VPSPAPVGILPVGILPVDVVAGGSSTAGARMAGMVRRFAIAAMIVPLFTLAGRGAFGADLRCAAHVVTTGMTLLEVRERCGAPLVEEHRAEELAPGVWIDVDEWTYEFGANRFRRLLRFENGRLEDIEALRKPVLPGGGD